MNNQDYKNAFREIKPSKELNDRLVHQIINNEKWQAPSLMLNNKADKRAGLNNRNIIRVATICLVLFSMTGITVAAATGNLADLFKGYFKETATNTQDNQSGSNHNGNNPNGANPNGINHNSTNGNNITPDTRPVTNDSAFLNKAGALINATDTEAGLKLTARGIVGDDRALYIAIDVNTENGQAFTKEQETQLNSIHFQEVKLQIDQDPLGQYSGCTRIDDGTEKGKATFLIQDMIQGKKLTDISGHKLTVTLTNLLHTTHALEDIGMEGNLYDIFIKFEQPADKDYQFYSVRSDSKHTEEENKILEAYNLARRSGKLSDDAFLKLRDELIQAGLLEPLYILPETATKIRFCTKYPKLEITNMGIKNNIFTFNIKLNDELDYQYLNTKHLALVNRKTGACVGTTMDIDEWEGDEKGKLKSAHFVVFHTITSAEQLKDYDLTIGGYGAEDIINEGEWKLTFPLSYEDTTRSYEVDKKATISGFTGTINALELSPLSMKISFQANQAMNAANKALFEDQWVKNKNNLYLIMKDGTKISNLSISEDIQNDTFTFQAMFPYVIDLKQIDKIVIDKNELMVN